ncbi:hypothetical protein [Streptomyces sp. NPDC006739]|uniref:hypothetical protein n=1 Tax=Streptomyces sp. NPDC006739 TaxID=3364763 RepID=UPI0036CF34C4
MRGRLTGTAITLGAGVLLTAGLTTASAAPPTTPPTRAAALQPVLVDCLWHRNVRPADFILACGDGNSRLTALHWSQWGPSGAKAVGVNVVNDCDPYCAAGRFHPYPVTVRLDRPQPWKKDPGVRHFTRMTLTYSGARPDGYHQVETYPLWN